MDPNSHHPTITNYSSYHSLLQPQISNPNPNPNPDPLQLAEPLKPHEPHYGVVGIDTSLRHPGIDPSPSVSSNSLGLVAAYEAEQPRGVAYAHHQTVASVATAASVYYRDPNVVAALQNWAAETVQQYVANSYGVAIPPNGTQQLLPANLNSTPWTNPTIQPGGNGTWKRGPKKTKVVQSAWCEICRLVCNSKDVLDKHKIGKKHKKNLEKLNQATAPAPAPAPAPTPTPAPTPALAASAESNNPVIGPQENPDKRKSVSGKKSKKAAMEDLGTKRRKILEGGAAADAVRACAICNVVCNSETVFRYHLAGQKHASMMKKHATAAGAAIPT